MEQLLLLATQANNTRIFLDPGLLGKTRSNAVHGNMDLESALFLALRGTGFTDYRHPTGTIMLRRSTETPVGPQHLRPRSDPPRTRAEGPIEGDQSPPRLEELVVLGTKMHHEEPIGAPTISLTQEDLIDSGFADFDALIRSEPQAFQGGPGPVSRSVHPDALTNSGFGSAINFRGFGAGSTLILVNHGRLAPSGSAGRFTDVSNLPTIAIDHVDTITDGSSALYGADAVGGVVNFVTRDGRSSTDTRAHIASVTEGGYHEALLGQFIGLPWDTGSLGLAAEYLKQPPLQADARGFMTSNLTRWKGPDWDTSEAAPGTELVGNSSYAIPPSLNGRPKAAQFQEGTANHEDLYRNYSLIAAQERHSLYGNLKQSFDGWAWLNLVAFVTDREARQQNGGQRLSLQVPITNPFYVNPQGGTDPVQVGFDFAPILGPLTTVSRVRTSSALLTLDIPIGKTSTLTVMASSARERERQHNTGGVDQSSAAPFLADPDPSIALNLFGDGRQVNAGTAAGIQTQSAFSSSSMLNDIALTFDGKLTDLPAGPLEQALGVEYREQHLDAYYTGDIALPSLNEHFSRHVTSATAEYTIPVLAGTQSGFNALKLSLASRFDAYGDVGSTVEPQLRLEWKPAPHWQILAGLARSVREPNLAELSESINGAAVNILPDATSPTHQSEVLYWFGNNSHLAAEKALSRTLGLHWSSAESHFKTQLSYFDVRFADRIAAPAQSPTALDSSTDSTLVTRNPDNTLLQRICSTSQFPGGPNACLNSAVGAVIDLRLRNGETLYSRGLDFSGTALSEAHPWGKLGYQLQGSYLFKYSIKADERPEQSQLSTIYNPIDLHLNSALSWERKDFVAGATLHFTNKYRNTLIAPAQEIASWTTVDFLLKYKTALYTDSGLSGIELALTCQNCLDRGPPFSVNPLDQMGFDPTNSTVLNRIVGLSLRKLW